MRDDSEQAHDAGFFFYGTLMRGEANFHVVETLGIESIQPARATGRLVDLGRYPGLIAATADGQQVHGEFVRLSQSDAALVSLDKLEDFRGFGLPGSLYHRKLVTVDLDDGSRPWAWIYEYAGDVSHAPIIPSGDWRQYRRDR